MRAEMEQALAEFVVSPSDESATLQLLDQLDAPRYAERRAAFAALLEESALPVGLISKFRGDAASDNQRMMIDQLLNLNDETSAEKRLRGLLKEIATEGITGLSAQVLSALQGREATDAGTTDWARRAIRATVQPGDLPKIRVALKSPTVLVRRAAVVGMAEVLGEAEIDLLLALREDADDATRFRIAILLAEREHRECLDVFASLLHSKAFAYRIQSADALILLTGQDFGYLADAIPEQRKEPADLWGRWVKKFGAKAELAFDQFMLMEDGFGEP